MPMENVWDIIPVLFLTFHLIVTIAASNSHASLYKDVNGTLHVFSTNEHMPFAVNGINIFRAVDGAVKCIQLPCPPYHFRTGCEGLMSTGYCTVCPPCPDWQYRSGCGGISRGVCINATTCRVHEFEAKPPTATTDRICAPFTSCRRNEFEIRKPTKTGDRICLAKNEPRYHIACSRTSDLVLDCLNHSSRTAVSENNMCEVAKVDNCCCEEFSTLLFLEVTFMCIKMRRL